jgi:hypothetical protein
MVLGNNSGILRGSTAGGRVREFGGEIEDGNEGER